MCNHPLRGKTIVVTGTSAITNIIDEVEQLGGEAVRYPLIETVEVIESYDHLLLQMTKSVDWIIFTSQNGVDYFFNKVKRLKKPISFRCKIAAVGEKTAERLEKNHLTAHFIPSVYSADVFVKEFPFVAGENPRCLFVRGKKAKDTIKQGLPFSVHEWNVYDIQEKRESIQHLTECIQTKEEVIITFASPSAVDVYVKYIASTMGWRAPNLTFASIGHITTGALKSYGAPVTYQPTTYTMQAVIKEIVNREEGVL